MDQAESVRRGWKPKRHFLYTALTLLAIGVVFYAVWKAGETPRGEAFRTLLGEFLNDKDRPPADKLIGNAILQNYFEYRENAIRWSGVYHSCLFFSAALGALAGLLLKLEFFIKNADLKKDLAALSAMSSALLITFSTVGDFQTHWQANRLAAGRMENLGYEFVTDGKEKDLAYFSSRIREINMGRNQEIVGNSDGPTPARVPTH
jgi:hypothetical protein